MGNLTWKVVLVLVLIGLSIWSIYPLKERINLGLDLQGGIHLVMKADTSKLSKDEAQDAAQRAVEVIRNRVDELGVKEPTIQVQGENRILVQLPGETDRERALNLIGKTALLEFKLVSDDIEKLRQAKDGTVPEGYELKPLKRKDGTEDELLLDKEPAVTGGVIKNAYVSVDQWGAPDVHIEFNQKGARLFSKVTGENVGKRLAIVLDGTVHSAPNINEKIPSGEAQITGNFSQQEAQDLALVLRAGALPVPVYPEEERTVGPLLGKDSIQKGIKATWVGSAVVIIFMLVYYLLGGVIANVSLVLNILFLFGCLSALHATLTLPGIAGIALTVGMAVDANVLILERIREERKLGKSLSAAIDAGYHKAFITILDSNLTTLITGVILYIIGTGPVRGFAVTLSLGIIINLFTGVFVTRIIFDLLLKKKGLSNLAMLQIMREPKFSFIGKRRIAYVISIAVIALGLVSFFNRGVKNFGVDFTGGSLQHIIFEKPVEINQVRDALKDLGLGDVAIQQDVKEKKLVMIRTYADVSGKISEQFKKTFPDNPFEVSVDMVGPTVGKELRQKAVWAVVLSLLGICAYVSWRFEFRFALGGIVALLHDVLICVGMLALTGREISLPVLAALLTIIGFSINDTIVIFDRIRENMKGKGKISFAELIDMSVNQTLSRTILTSTTVFMVVLSLFVLGGEVLHAFAFTLLVGTITGVYSTVYVAAPIVLDWPAKKK